MGTGAGREGRELAQQRSGSRVESAERGGAKFGRGLSMFFLFLFLDDAVRRPADRWWWGAAEGSVDGFDSLGDQQLMEG